MHPASVHILTLLQATLHSSLTQCPPAVARDQTSGQPEVCSYSDFQAHFTSLFPAWSRTQLIAALGCSASRQKHTLPDLPYDYGALQPHINAEIMQLHHSKHHATYVNNLNVAEEKYKEALAKGDVTAQVSLQPALKFNGGGHINHTIFWTNLSPNGGGEPQGELMEAIKRDFGSFGNFKEKLTAVSVGVQGSGWGWLGFNQDQGRLQVTACYNQDPLQGTTGLIPLLGIDVWEHAYYLQYKNVRPDYLKAIWNVISWENVSARYTACKK
ncbi:carabin [Platysternon megacephalum]|uniref:Superoxide dismutase [Mn], mitochondrial n=2 Tax=Testudinoidea TaxID=8486 RepID=A0A4D9DW92_9SAUR|nr:carabin [Platysternon megacephalum]